MLHGITCQVISGESKDVPVESVAEWHIISEYQTKDVFISEETGLSII